MTSLSENERRQLQPPAGSTQARQYEVGYGKPPQATRFQPGKSGNPKGRPKGSRNRTKLPALNEERLKSIILEDMQTGGVRLKGPMTKEEQQHWNWLRERKHEFQAELDELQQLLRDEPDYPYRDFVEKDIEHDRKIVAMIGRVIPD